MAGIETKQQLGSVPAAALAVQPSGHGEPSTVAQAPAATSQRRALPSGGWLIGPLFGLVWMIYPFRAVLTSHPSPTRVIFTFALAPLFSSIFLWLIWLHDPLGTTVADAAEIQKRRAAVTILTALAVALILFSAGEWHALFFHLNIVAGIMLLRRDAYVAIIVLALLTATLGIKTGLAWLILPTAALGLWATAFVSQVTAVTELQAAREELARLAVAEERLRFARDLHDLLGHSLTLITIKSELAGRLLPAAPEQAAREIGDVHDVARRALRDVRETVSGYRQPTLLEELHGAREVLDAAGIACHIENTLGPLPKSLETLLAWAVREGTTNVIRHSRASHCDIQLLRQGGAPEMVQVTISDDGRGLVPQRAAAGRPARGNGLAGLAERVADIAGADFVAGPHPEGGFRLCVRLPLDAGSNGVGKGGRR